MREQARQRLLVIIDAHGGDEVAADDVPRGAVVEQLGLTCLERRQCRLDDALGRQRHVDAGATLVERDAHARTHRLDVSELQLYGAEERGWRTGDDDINYSDVIMTRHYDVSANS